MKPDDGAPSSRRERRARIMGLSVAALLFWMLRGATGVGVGGARVMTAARDLAGARRQTDRT